MAFYEGIVIFVQGNSNLIFLLNLKVVFRHEIENGHI